MALVSVFTASALSLHRSASAEPRSRSGRESDGDLPHGRLHRHPDRRHPDPDLEPSLRVRSHGRFDASRRPPARHSPARTATLPVPSRPWRPPATRCRTVTGPDGRSYTVDTYVDYVNNDATLSIATPAAGLTLKLVTVVVRDPEHRRRARERLVGVPLELTAALRRRARGSRAREAARARDRAACSGREARRRASRGSRPTGASSAPPARRPAASGRAPA